jgi:hypothetical protein
VYSTSDWPGLTAKASDLGVRVLTEKRPAFYFRPLAHETASTPLTLPGCLRGVALERAHAILQSDTRRQETEAYAFVKAQGWKVLGKVAVRSVSPYRSAESWEQLGKLVRPFASSSSFVARTARPSSAGARASTMWCSRPGRT